MSKFVTQREFNSNKTSSRSGSDYRAPSISVLVGIITDTSHSDKVNGTVAAPFNAYKIDVYNLQTYAPTEVALDGKTKVKGTDVKAIEAPPSGVTSLAIGTSCLLLTRNTHSVGDVLSVIDRGFFFEEISGGGGSFPYGSTWTFGYTMDSTYFNIHHPSIYKGRDFYDGSDVSFTLSSLGVGSFVVGVEFDYNSPASSTSAYDTDVGSFLTVTDEAKFRVPCYNITIAEVEGSDPTTYSCTMTRDYVHGAVFPNWYS